MTVSQAWTPLHKAIDRPLNDLMKACDYHGESGTEEFFWVLADAVARVKKDWDAVVGQSHRNGLCYDVNALLTDALVDVLSETERDGRDRRH